MNDLRELRSLRRHFTQRPDPTPDLVAQYFRSDDYLAQLDGLSGDPRALARLTINLLKHMSLDPKSGTTVEEHLGKLGADGAYFVCLHIHRTVNVIGGFNLPADAPEVDELKQAITQNLASRMFKAAQMHRRLEQRNMARFRRITRVANEAKAAFLNEQLVKAPHESRTFEYRAFMKETYEKAAEVYDAVYKPLHDRLTGRVRAVGQIAFDEDFRGAYTEILTAFAKRYLVPATLH